MELVMAIAIGILFTIGVYLILSKILLRVVLGTSLLTHGVHLLLLTMAGLKRGQLLCWVMRRLMSTRCRRL